MFEISFSLKHCESHSHRLKFGSVVIKRKLPHVLYMEHSVHLHIS